ncbi:hypothetical protein AM628_18615 [Vibrio cholerae O1 biovar El Tor]|nr:hypothetical protein AM628_18615 [Vibrio cholerae O1 biovar El Tor]
MGVLKPQNFPPGKIFPRGKFWGPLFPPKGGKPPGVFKTPGVLKGGPFLGVFKTPKIFPPGENFSPGGKFLGAPFFPQKGENPRGVFKNPRGFLKRGPPFLGGF